MSFNPIQAQSFTLSGSGSAIGDVVLNLKSFKDINSTNIALADIGSKGYGTLEPGNGSQEEQISFTGVTQNSDGSAQLTGVSTVLFKSPYTETSGMAKTHAGSVTFVLSNTAGFYNQFGILSNNEAILGDWTVPTSAPLSAGSLTSKSWVLSVVTATGQSISTNQVITGGTAGENLAIGQVVYLKNDGRWYKASSTATAQALNVMLGIVQGTVTTGNPCSVLINGVDQTQSGLVTGKTYYMATGGALSSSIGTIGVDVGEAISATTLQFKPFFSETVTTPGSASQGDVLYHNGTNWTRLAAGTSGQFLKTLGTGANVSWAPTGTLISTVATASAFTQDGSNHTWLTMTIPGGSLGTTGVLRIRAVVKGSFSNGTANAQNQNLGLSYGGTSATLAFSSIPDINQAGLIEFLLYNTTASTQTISGFGSIGRTDASATGIGIISTVTTGIAIDSTANQTLTLSNAFSTNSGETFTVNFVTVEQIK